MSEFVKVADSEDLIVGEGLMVEVGGEQIALFRLADGRFCAVEDKCPHRGAPLSEGAVVTGTVRCPWHAARFDLVSGKVLSAPARRDLKTYAVESRPDGIYVSVS